MPRNRQAVVFKQLSHFIWQLQICRILRSFSEAKLLLSADLHARFLRQNAGSEKFTANCRRTHIMRENARVRPPHLEDFFLFVCVKTRSVSVKLDPVWRGFFLKMTFSRAFLCGKHDGVVAWFKSLHNSPGSSTRRRAIKNAK